MTKNNSPSTSAKISKLFNFPAIDEIERRIRKSKRMASAVFSRYQPIASASHHDQPNQECVLISAVERSISAIITPAMENQMNNERSKFSKESNEGISKRVWNKAKRITSLVFVFLCFLIFFLGIIGGLATTYELATDYLYGEEDYGRYDIIILDKMEMTYKITKKLN